MTSADDPAATRKRTELSDALSMRAYAHPLRLKLVVLLRRHGPHTATQAAKVLHDNVPNCSFHLRQLAKYGLVERADGSDKRERPWRATTMTTSWNDAVADPEKRAAADHLTSVIVDEYFDFAREWLRRREDESIEWRGVTGIGDQTLHVTVEEMAEIQRRLREVTAPFRDRDSDPALRPAGSRAINMVTLAMPWDEP